MNYDSDSARASWLTQCLSPHANDTYPTFLQRRATSPDRVALIHRDRTYTYKQLHTAIEATAKVLVAEYGVTPGDRVMINMENSDYFVILYLAIQRAGATAVPINPKLVGSEITYLLSDARPVLYVCDDNRIDAVDSMNSSASMTAAAVSTVMHARCGDAQLPEPNPDLPATIFYTSGTTGVPKGVVHTHRTLIAGAFQNSRSWGYDQSGSVTLAVTPLFHVAAHAWFYPVLAFQGTLIVDGFKVERSFDMIERFQVDGMGAVPAMLLMMIGSEKRNQYNLSSVRNIRFGASPMPPEKLLAVQELFPHAALYHGMGQTESGGTISVLPGTLAFSKNGSTGYPIPGCDVRIVDDAGRDLPSGALGEVLARGPNVMKGYFNMPEATASTLVDGWLHTGDIGYIDEEGCIYLVDRKKDMIIRGGENVYSVEIEHVIMQHPSVEKCAVFGVPDAVLGEKVCAMIVPLPREGQDLTTDGLLGELEALCREKLALFKVPQVWRAPKELPCTATGKVQKAILRKQAAVLLYGG